MTTTLATHGYELREADNTFVAWFEHIEDATHALRKQVRGTHVIRCRDGVLLATSRPRGQRRVA